MAKMSLTIRPRTMGSQQDVRPEMVIMSEIPCSSTCALLTVAYSVVPLNRTAAIFLHRQTWHKVPVAALRAGLLWYVIIPVIINHKEMGDDGKLQSMCLKVCRWRERTSAVLKISYLMRSIFYVFPFFFHRSSHCHKVATCHCQAGHEALWQGPPSLA